MQVRDTSKKASYRACPGSADLVDLSELQKKKVNTEKEGLINLIKCLSRAHKYKYNKGAEARETMRC